MAKQRRVRGRNNRAGLSLLAVQSIACGVVLLLALLLRLIGGTAWSGLRSLLHGWLTDDGLAQVIAENVETDSGGVDGRDVGMSETAGVYCPPNSITWAPLTAPLTTVAPLTEGRVTSSFGVRTDPIRGGTSVHSGTDVAAPAGTPLYALYDGEVSVAGWQTSYGNRITVRAADGLEVCYAHCSALLKRTGDTVRAGEVIARVGSTGDSTGNHVHIMAIREGIFYDPAPLIPEGFYA